MSYCAFVSAVTTYEFNCSQIYQCILLLSKPVAISEEFGLKPGTISTGRMVNALRELGFDYITDTNFSADLTIMEEANELLARLSGERELKYEQNFPV